MATPEEAAAAQAAAEIVDLTPILADVEAKPPVEEATPVAVAVDVKFYSDIPAEKKPEGIPDVWPAETAEVTDLAAPVKPGHTRMTIEEYKAYQEQHQETYDDWDDNKPLSAEQLATQADTDKLTELADKPREKWTTEDLMLAVQIILQRQAGRW